MIVLKEDHQYSDRPITIDEAKKTCPESIHTIKAGSILWGQNTTFTIEQVAEVKEKGFHYQWGFGPCYEMIPTDKVKFVKITELAV